MSIFFSPGSGGFYHSDLHPTPPDDAVFVSEMLHRQLMAAQSAGGRIVAGKDGRPTVRKPAGSSIEHRRSMAIAAIKAEAARRIDAVAPVWRQLNALRAAAGAADPLFIGIDAIRAAGDTLEVAVAAMPARSLAQLDVTAAVHWPT